MRAGFGPLRFRDLFVPVAVGGKRLRVRWFRGQWRRSGSGVGGVTLWNPRLLASKGGVEAAFSAVEAERERSLDPLVLGVFTWVGMWVRGGPTALENARFAHRRRTPYS